METFVDNPPPLTLGLVLAAERERLGMSRADVAQRLHMSAWQVEALENGDYARLPQGTFLRGFVRNYSKLLGIDADAALARLAEVAPRNPAPAIVVPSQNIRFDPIGERLTNPYVKAGALLVVALALGFAAMYWWLFIRPTPPAAAKKEAVQRPVPQNLAAAPVAPAEPVVVQEAPQAESGGQTPPSAKAGERTVKLRFRGSSWVEIRDRNGRILASGINAPGSEAEVSGRAPLNVTVGNAPQVTMLYEGREFPLEPHTRVAVARVTLE